MTNLRIAETKRIDAVAKKLIKALAAMEQLFDDPSDYLDSAVIKAHSHSQGVKSVLNALKEYYETPSK